MLPGKISIKRLQTLTKRRAELEAKDYHVHHKEISRVAGNMTVEEAIDKYINSRDGVLSPSTIRGYDIIKRNSLPDN